MKSIINRFDSLITNNTGYSSKSFTLVLATILILLISLNILAMMWVDLLIPEAKIDTDLYALAGLIGALGGLLGYLYHQKVRSENTTK